MLQVTESVSGKMRTNSIHITCLLRTNWLCLLSPALPEQNPRGTRGRMLGQSSAQTMTSALAAGLNFCRIFGMEGRRQAKGDAIDLYYQGLGMYHFKCSSQWARGTWQRPWMSNSQKKPESPRPPLPALIQIVFIYDQRFKGMSNIQITQHRSLYMLTMLD